MPGEEPAHFPEDTSMVQHMKHGKKTVQCVHNTIERITMADKMPSLRQWCCGMGVAKLRTRERQEV